jgi:hypothetical protein
MRIELTTYALRVRSGCKLVESGGDTSATVKGFMHFLGVRRSGTEASGFTTELTTLGDIHRSAASARLLLRPTTIQTNFRLVIYTAPAPRNPGTFSNSSAAAPATWVTIFVGQWIDTHAFLFGSRPQSSERWTCWPAPVTGPAARSSGKRLSSTSQHDSVPPTTKMSPGVDEYLLSGLVTPC